MPKEGTAMMRGGERMSNGSRTRPAARASRERREGLREEEADDKAAAMMRMTLMMR
jgi:hypothetical protein